MPNTSKRYAIAIIYSRVKLESAEIAKKNGAERSLAIDAELVSLNEELSSLKTVTLEEFLERRPELREKLIDDMMNDKWFVEQ